MTTSLDALRAEVNKCNPRPSEVAALTIHFFKELGINPLDAFHEVIDAESRDIPCVEALVSYARLHDGILVIRKVRYTSVHNPTNVRTSAARLVRRGVLERIERGVYRLI